MTDLDFEELDRAVNSAMGTEQSGVSEEDVKNIKIKADDESAPIDTVSQERKIQSPEPRKSEKAVFKSRQAVRSSGRFMDVVHPSADMRPNLYPKSEDKDSQKQKKEETKTEKEITNPHNMPDPLDVHKETDSKSKSNEGEDKKSDSPFIADAKVEKRPLGAFSDIDKKESETTKNPTDEKKDTLVEEPLKDEAPYEPNSESRNVYLPPELQKDILDVESDPTTDKLGSSNPNKSKDPVPLGNPYLHSAQTEISQQYKEKNSQEKTSGSIYDTKEYHSPLSHPAKKKNGWNVIIWILLIVAVAIGIAYFVYSYLFAK